MTFYGDVDKVKGLQILACWFDAHRTNPSLTPMDGAFVSFDEDIVVARRPGRMAFAIQKRRTEK